MKTQDKSQKQNLPGSSHKKQSQDSSSKKGAENAGDTISTNSSKEDPTKPKRLGESQTEITDETTI
jgi:hypothetical protein